MGSIDTFDRMCCHLSAESRCIVASVEYRLAPEHRFPAGLDDAFAATIWVIENRDALGAKSARIALVGDSAGAGLVAGVTLNMRQAHLPAVDF